MLIYSGGMVARVVSPIIETTRNTVEVLIRDVNTPQILVIIFDNVATRSWKFGNALGKHTNELIISTIVIYTPLSDNTE